jgi:3-dehydroquinate synthetase
MKPASGHSQFGHTFGHAIEAAGGFDVYAREAVAIGMVWATDLSLRMGLCDRHCSTVKGLLRSSDWIAPGTHWGIRDTLLTDKKAVAGRLRFILAEGWGRCRFATMSQPSSSNIIDDG